MDNQKKLKFAAINRYDSSFKDSVFERKADFYIKFGEYNDFPNELMRLFTHSSIHNTCINAVVEAISGEGLTSDHPEILDHANNEGETWQQILTKVALDYKLFGAFALEVIWSMDRTRIAEVYHMDYTYLRAKEKTLRGKIPGYYIWDEWGEKYSWNIQTYLNDIPYLPVFNPFTKDAEPKQIFVHSPYRPGQKYYALPDYIGAYKVIELDAEVDNFHINNIRNGLAPSLAITTFTNANEDEREAIEHMLRLQYQGTNNAGTLVYMDVDSPENAPIITPIPQNGADEYYTQINDLVTQKILTAHRITSPMMLGIKTEGQLGGRDETIDAYLLFTNTVIKPFQQDILDAFHKILEYKTGLPEFSLGIQQTKLYSDGTEEVDVVTGTEAEVGEDSVLEAEIERADQINEPALINPTFN